MISFQKEINKYKNVIGIDEVGRGTLAGPVIAAAVLLKEDIEIHGINDSKKLSFKKRNLLFNKIINHSHYSIGISSVKEIDKLNILQASLLAMRRAASSFIKTKFKIIVDGPYSFNIKNKNILPIIKGDQKYPSIAAASIIAKVTRDNFMTILSNKYPLYGWETNFGYGTRLHLNQIKKHGITSMHRKSFDPIHKILFKKN